MREFAAPIPIGPQIEFESKFEFEFERRNWELWQTNGRSERTRENSLAFDEERERESQDEETKPQAPDGAKIHLSVLSFDLHASRKSLGARLSSGQEAQLASELRNVRASSNTIEDFQFECPTTQRQIGHLRGRIEAPIKGARGAETRLTWIKFIRRAHIKPNMRPTATH